MKKPRVNILLPYWGDFELLRQTIDSVLRQTSNEWNLLIFDDCYPTNDARDYCASLKDTRISYVRHEENIGITRNFNFALEAATAEYCVMIGCDDVMLPNYIDTALSSIRGADFYQPGVEIIDGNSKPYLPLVDRVKRMIQPRKAGLKQGEKLASSLCIGNWLYFPSIMWKTDTIKKYRFDATYTIAEDLALELAIIKDGGTLQFDKSVLFQYRRFAESLSSREKNKGGVRFGEEASVYNHFADEFTEIGWHKAARSARIRITSRIHELIS